MPAETERSDDGNNGHASAKHRIQPRISTESTSGTGRMLAVAVTVLAIVLAICFAVGFWVREHTEHTADQLAAATVDAKPIVDLVIARPSARSYPLTLPGQTAGWYESTIFARVDGYVGKWTANFGDRVKQGDVLATIDTPELDQQLNAALAKEAASEAQVKVAESTVSITKLTYERWKDSPRGVVSEQEREEKQAAYEEANARLAAANAQVKLDMADVGRYTAMEAFKKVTAPYDGVITARKLDIGVLVSAGSSANTTSLYDIAQTTRIRVYVDVPQKAAAQMTAGLAADVVCDQFPGRVFHGTVTRSTMSIDPQTLTERTEVDIPNPDLELVRGARVQVTFQLSQQGLPEVPAAAILNRPGGLQVAVVNSSDKVEFRPVTVAKDNGDMVVLATGVKPGERVALNLSTAIQPGDEVKVDDENPGSSSTAPPVAEAGTR